MCNEIACLAAFFMPKCRLVIRFMIRLVIIRISLNMNALNAWRVLKNPLYLRYNYEEHWRLTKPRCSIGAGGRWCES